MSIYAKFVFFAVVVLSYSLSYVFAKTNSIKALEKLLIIFYATLLLLSVLFPEATVVSVSQLLGVSRYTDSLLFLFIVLSLSINFVLTRKVVEMDQRIKSLVQHISLTRVTERNGLTPK